jgi:hypothetical protein
MRFLPILSAVFLSIPLFSQAASVTYVLDQSNEEGRFPDGTPYAQVTINDDTPNELRFVVDLLPVLLSQAGSNLGIQAFGFNVTGNSGLNDANNSNSQWTLPSSWRARVAPPNNQLDGFGRFDVSIEGNGNSRREPLQFSILNSSLTLDRFAELSTGNAGQGNVFFAAHIAGFKNPSPTSAYFGGSSEVPLPAAAWLFGLALTGLGLTGRTGRRI